MYESVEKQSQEYLVGLLCEVMGGRRSAYYAYAAGQTYPSRRGTAAPKREQRRSQVQAVFTEHKRRDGSRRLVHALRAKGQRVGRDFVRKVLQESELSAIQPCSFVPRTTNSRHTLGFSPNLLLTMDLPTAPNQVWVSDITYIMLANGRCMSRADDPLRSHIGQG